MKINMQTLNKPYRFIGKVFPEGYMSLPAEVKIFLPKENKAIQYPVIIDKTKYGYDVHCPVFSGCHSQGDTCEEAIDNIKDAIKTYLQMIAGDDPMMSLKNEIKKYALSQGAQLVGMTRVEVYADYLAEVEKRLQDTGAILEDFMVSPAANMPRPEPISFFSRLSDPCETLPTAKTIIVIGVYAYDRAAVYKNTRQELRGKTARTYNYYPVARQVAERVAAFIEEQGHKAIHGQHIPLKFVANRIGLGAYGKNGIFQTSQYGSYIALRNVITEVRLAPDKFASTSVRCGECELCLRACPTGALYAPYKVNPKLCINPLTRRDTYIEPQIRSKMQDWISGCDICQEVCPANRDLSPRELDPRAGFDPRHHASHKNLDGLERTPILSTLLAAKWPKIIRRNAAIALVNIGKGRKEALKALQEQVDSTPSVLEAYFTWAMKELESTGEQT